MQIEAKGTHGSMKLGIPLLMFLLKPFADMFWQYQVFDAALFTVALSALIINALQSEVRYGLIDVLVMLLMAMFFVSYLRNTSGFTVLIKVESAFILYFMGRVLYNSKDNIIRILLVSYGLVILVNYIVMAFGTGYQYWGAAHTFSGLYYFKTDLASAATMTFTLFLYWGKGKAIRPMILAASGALVVLSNARSYYIALILIISIYILFRKGCRINLRIAFTTVMVCIGALFFLNWLFSTGVFDDLGFIGIRFNRLSDLFDASNTQGRNVVWAEIISRMRDYGTASQLFGVDLVSDQVAVNGGLYGSHSLYVGSLFNIGYSGLLVLFTFMSSVLLKLRVIQINSDNRYSFFTLSLITTFLVAGISVHTLQFTSTSWLPMFFAGAGVSLAASSYHSNPSIGGTRVIPAADDHNVLPDDTQVSYIDAITV